MLGSFFIISICLKSCTGDIEWIGHIRCFQKAFIKVKFIMPSTFWAMGATHWFFFILVFLFRDNAMSFIVYIFQLIFISASCKIFELKAMEQREYWGAGNGRHLCVRKRHHWILLIAFLVFFRSHRLFLWSSLFIGCVPELLKKRFWLSQNFGENRNFFWKRW